MLKYRPTAIDNIKNRTKNYQTRNKNKNYAINEVKIPESVIQNKKYMV